jgi:Lrp/AsnC family leucine-responsive transcriptional regulator
MQHSTASNPLSPVDLRLLALLQQDCALTNQALAERAAVSPATALRRVKALVEAGVIERQVAVLNPERIGAGLSAIAEVTLDRQGAEWLDAFEAHALPFSEVQQCYRVSPGPDFVLVLQVADMPAYAELAQRLFTAQANVRNVKAFFSVRRAKFHPQLALPKAP